MDDRKTTHPSFLEGQRLARRASNAPLKAVIDHWLNLHDGKRLPAREQLDPIDLPGRIMPYLFLLERTPGPEWRVRLMGSHLVAALGGDFTGRDMVDAQIPEISRSRTLRMLGEIAETGLPAHFHGRTGYRFRDDIEDHEQILLPFRESDDDAVALVLGVIVYEGMLKGYGPGSTW